jgi:hypothetical protein
MPRPGAVAGLQTSYVKGDDMLHWNRQRIEYLESQLKYNEKRTDRCIELIRELNNELDLLVQALGYNRVAYQAKVAYERKGGPEKP